MGCNTSQQRLMSSIRRIHRCVHALNRDGFRQDEMVLMNIYHQQSLSADGGIRVSALGRQAHLSPPALSRCLRQLEQESLIRRSMDREDRRGLRVSLTEAGLRHAQQTEEEDFPCFERVFRTMGESDVLELIRLTEQFSDLLEQEFQETTDSHRERGEEHP